MEERLAETHARAQSLTEQLAASDAERMSLSTQLSALSAAWQQASARLEEQGANVTTLFQDNKTLKQDLRRVRDKHKYDLISIAFIALQQRLDPHLSAHIATPDTHIDRLYLM